MLSCWAPELPSKENIYTQGRKTKSVWGTGFFSGQFEPSSFQAAHHPNWSKSEYLGCHGRCLRGMPCIEPQQLAQDPSPFQTTPGLFSNEHQHCIAILKNPPIFRAPLIGIRLCRLWPWWNIRTSAKRPRSPQWHPMALPQKDTSLACKAMASPECGSSMLTLKTCVEIKEERGPWPEIQIMQKRSNHNLPLVGKHHIPTGGSRVPHEEAWSFRVFWPIKLALEAPRLTRLGTRTMRDWCTRFPQFAMCLASMLAPVVCSSPRSFHPESTRIWATEVQPSCISSRPRYQLFVSVQHAHLGCKHLTIRFRTDHGSRTGISHRLKIPQKGFTLNVQG